jgi:tRNA(Leu) C34 or U34 (ribose-2'-O)-methylase TrmL
MYSELFPAAIALTNPKYPHNVGNALRACSCWAVNRLFWSGNRVPHPEQWKESELAQYRIPREERMKGYKDVELIRTDRFKEIISQYNFTPVAVEVMEEAENLFEFVHPPNPLYIFGPEDGGLNKPILQHCHRFLKIPTVHCLNLACAINVILGHRAQQIYINTGNCLTLKEERGFIL